MTLIERLRAALADGNAPTSSLLDGDPGDPLLGTELAAHPAAVLIAIVDRPEPAVILTVRPDTLRTHAGQIAFPGGRIDPGDDGPVDAALREAEEEVGLRRADATVIGALDRYRTITGFDVTPVLAVVPAGLHLVPHEHEVADLFEAPLAYLLDAGNQTLRSVLWQGQQRCYYEILWQDRRIWGATAAMIVNLSRRIGAFA